MKSYIIVNKCSSLDKDIVNYLHCFKKKFSFAKKFLIQRNMINVELDYQTRSIELKIITTSKNK